jgi:prepilin-type N-terminal cleavage/methylation domain-containing protein
MRRRGYTLLEVMVSLGILVTVLVILLEAQSQAAWATLESRRLLIANDLALKKVAEVLLLMEEEGFTDVDLREEGDFDDFGDDVLEIQLGDELEDYHYEWWVSQIDIGLAGDLASMAQGLEDSNLVPTGTTEEMAEGGGMPDLGMLGFSNEMMSERMAMFTREVRVRVYWGDDSEEAEKLKNDIVLVTHITNPTGKVIPSNGENPLAVPDAGGGL